MKNLTTAIYSLFSTSTLASLIGGRLYKGQAPEGAEYPYAVYMLISDVPDPVFGKLGEDAYFQFSLFSGASSSGEIEDLYAALKTAYDDQPLTITNDTHIWTQRINAVMNIEEHTTPAGTQKVWAYHVDYRIYVVD